jgi:Fe-S-cluster containining protein
LKLDAKRISNNTLLDVNEFSQEISGSEPYIHEMKKNENGKCFFLKDNNCTIYEIRPLICRFYPFELKNLGNNRYSFSYTNKCKGIGNVPELELTFFESLFNTCLKFMEENAEE